MKLTVVGCGDAFGSGGRLQTSYHVETPATRFLIDCGATALIGLNKLGIDPNAIPTIFISHLHGDHYAGLVWWLIHAQHVAKRTAPLTVVGPRGHRGALQGRRGGAVSGLQRRAAAIRPAVPGITREQPLDVGPVRVTPFEVKHASGAPPYALRFETDGKVLSFTGDTEWVESLVPAGQGADLYIMECYQFEGEPRFHTSWKTIEAQSRPHRRQARHAHAHGRGDAGPPRRGERPARACWPRTASCSTYEPGGGRACPAGARGQGVPHLQRRAGRRAAAP